MDSSRDADLRRLKAVMNNPEKSRGIRRTAHRTAKAIVKQMRDRTLREMRYRLVKAARAHDPNVEWKIANQIKDYLKQEKLER